MRRCQSFSEMARRAARAWASSTVLSSLRLTVLGVCVVSSIIGKEEGRRQKAEGRRKKAENRCENAIKSMVSAMKNVIAADGLARIMAVWLEFLNLENILHIITTKLAFLILVKFTDQNASTAVKVKSRDSGR